MSCVMAKDHPLRPGFTLQEYLSFPHVGVQMAGDLSTIDAVSLRQHVPSYRPSFTVADFSMIPYLVEGSTLVGIVQRHLATSACAALAIKALQPPFAIPNINEAILWHVRSTGDPSHEWLRALLTEEAADWSVGEATVHRPHAPPRASPRRARLYVAASA